MFLKVGEKNQQKVFKKVEKNIFNKVSKGYKKWCLSLLQMANKLELTFTFSHLADALIQTDLQSVQGHSPRGK